MSAEFMVTAESSRYRLDDVRWSAQARELHTALMHSETGARLLRIPAEGTKGFTETLVVGLTSAGTVTAALGIFKAWLARDKTRRIVVTWTSNGDEGRIVLEGDSLEAGALQLMAVELMARMNGATSWPDDTEPS
ncbi:hypothetical protein AB0K48_00150 [Nonomuraea sp. NPDC055795]